MFDHPNPSEQRNSIELGLASQNLDAQPAPPPEPMLLREYDERPVQSYGSPELVASDSRGMQPEPRGPAGAEIASNAPHEAEPRPPLADSGNGPTDPPSEHPPQASGADSPEGDNTSVPFLPFRQIFDGQQPTLPLPEQKAAGALLGDYVDDHLWRKSTVEGRVDVDKITREVDGRVVTVSIRADEIPLSGQQKRVTVSGVVSADDERVVSSDVSTYYVDENGVAKRTDPLDRPNIFGVPRYGYSRHTRSLGGGIVDLSRVIEYEKRRLGNQPVDTEELRALFGYIGPLVGWPHQKEQDV